LFCNFKSTRYAASFQIIQTPDSVITQLLVRYVEQLCNEYFCAGWLSGIESSNWEQIFANRQIFFDGQEPAHSLSDGEKDDLQYLLQQCNITCREQFVELESEG